MWTRTGIETRKVDQTGPKLVEEVILAGEAIKSVTRSIYHSKPKISRIVEQKIISKNLKPTKEQKKAGNLKASI